MTATGPVVDEQDLIAHLFAPMDGPHAGQAHVLIRDLWRWCQTGLGMTEPIPQTGLPAAWPDDLTELPEVAVAAGQQSPGAGSQAVLRREHDVLNLSVLLAGPADRGALPPLWPELDHLWAGTHHAGASELIGCALLYLGKAADPAGTGDDLAGLLPSAPAPGWRRTRLSPAAGVAAWEISGRDDRRAERRFVILARPDADAEVSTWTWSKRGAAMPPFARYLMHMAKIRYELRVHSAYPGAAALCRSADRSVAQVRDLMRAVTADGELRGADDRAALAGQMAALRHNGAEIAETGMALKAMRRTAEIAESNAANALGARPPGGSAQDFASDDRAVALAFGQRLDDDAAYLAVSLGGIRQVSELADGVISKLPDPASSRRPGMAVVLCALNVEYLAMQSHLNGLRQQEHPAGTRFEVGDLVGAGWQVAMAAIGQGNVSAAVIADRAISLFGPEVLLCVGVAGSLKDNIKLGDVVVATRVDAYDGGTAAEDFLARPRTWATPHRLDQLARELDRTGRWRQYLPAGTDRTPPAVHFRPIAAGEVVLDSRNAALFAQLRLHYNDAAAIEMEGAGIAQAAHLNDSLPALVIRSISDLADGKKADADRDGWQQRASANAAAFAAALLANLNPPPPR